VRVTADTDGELTFESNCLLYRTRLKSEEDRWIGLRRDKLRRDPDTGFKIGGRYIYLEQTLPLSRNLSNFF
jgi:biphenyl 2,3-dioxygenase beta subunit